MIKEDSLDYELTLLLTSMGLDENDEFFIDTIDKLRQYERGCEYKKAVDSILISNN